MGVPSGMVGAVEIPDGCFAVKGFPEAEASCRSQAVAYANSVEGSTGPDAETEYNDYVDRWNAAFDRSNDVCRSAIINEYCPGSPPPATTPPKSAPPSTKTPETPPVQPIVGGDQPPKKSSALPWVLGLVGVAVVVAGYYALSEPAPERNPNSNLSNRRRSA